MTSTLPRRLLAASLLVGMSACAGGPPVPDWQMNAQGAIERYEAAYMSGNTAVEHAEFARARDQIASNGKVALLLRVELLRCATRVASLVFDACPGYEALQQDAAAPERAYAAYLAGQASAATAALLPAQHRAVAGAASDTAAAQAVAAIADPLAQMVAAGVLLRANRATPALLANAVETASNQGWRRPLLAWLGVQAMRARQAGDAQEAQRIARRIALVQGERLQPGKDEAGKPR
ncbi:pimeloyl-ACP methyl ester carboxylesterase [Oxalobacteraceae bacterium GrIS 1.11]